MENLWPKLEKVDLNTPKAILAQQAEYFNSLETGLQAVVSTEQVQYHWEVLENEPEKSFQFVHTLRIKAGSYGGFIIPLLNVSHEPIGLYPAVVRNLLANKAIEVASEKELVGMLKMIFQSKETVDALQNMISMAK